MIYAILGPMWRQSDIAGMVQLLDVQLVMGSKPCYKGLSGKPRLNMQFFSRTVPVCWKNACWRYLSPNSASPDLEVWPE